MVDARPMSAAEFEQWVAEVLVPALEGAPLSAEEAAALPGGGLALLSADTDRIKEFVFESNRLPEIRGASMMLSELNEEGIKGVFERAGLRTDFVDDSPVGCWIYADGGSLLALVPRSHAAHLKTELEALYPRRTGMATITCVVLEIEPREVRDGYRRPDIPSLRMVPGSFQSRVATYFGRKSIAEVDASAVQARKHFGELVRLQALRLRQAKDEKETMPFFEAEPVVRRCESCRRRPAAFFETEPAPRYYCRVCYAKRGRDDRPERRLRKRALLHALFGPELEVPQDLEEIGEAARGSASGYVGFIYADGNSIGHTLEACRTPIAFRKRSRLLRGAVHDAVKNALQDLVTSRWRSVEVIAIGGDDTLLIVPGDVALEVARRICAGFQETLAKHGFAAEAATPPTMSAGVVIADSHNPVYFMRDLAEQLLKNAKRRAKGVAKAERTGTVDFLVLKSQSTLATSLAHLRENWPLARTDIPASERLLLTRRPYTLEELERLLALARRAGEAPTFPRSQLYALQEALLETGRMASSVYFLYQYARQPDRQRREFLHSLLWDGLDLEDREAVASAAAPVSPPWRERGVSDGISEYDTVLVDLLDVLDFCGGGPDGADG